MFPLSHHYLCLLGHNHHLQDLFYHHHHNLNWSFSWSFYRRLLFDPNIHQFRGHIQISILLFLLLLLEFFRTHLEWLNILLFLFYSRLSFCCSVLSCSCSSGLVNAYFIGSIYRGSFSEELRTVFRNNSLTRFLSGLNQSL